MFTVQTIDLAGFSVGPVEAHIESAVITGSNMTYIVEFKNGEEVVKREGYTVAYEGGDALAQAEADAQGRFA